MQTTRELILHHAETHPAAQVTDFVKLLYQSAFGGGHMISDEGESLKRLKAELAEMTDGQKRQPYTEMLGGEYCRMNLSVCREISPELANKIFAASAKAVTDGDKAEFSCATELLTELCKEHPKLFGFTAEDAAKYLEEYAKLNYLPVSHSEQYREKYQPAYRVVKKDFMRLLPLYIAVEKRVKESGSATVAIDGACGSGKSTAAALFAEIFDCNVFHADDFFLPPHKRTPERMSEIGGNMERERLESEILKNLKSGKAFSYAPFDCSVMALAEPRAVSPKAVNIVEGSYSMHPQLRGYYDFSVFLTVEPKVQEERILARSGEKMLERFKSEWIPKENAYFEKMKVRDACDFVF